MKNIENNPITKFKHLLKGSATARGLSFIYVVVSLTLAFKLRANLTYVIPLILGALLILWYTLTHLSIKDINLKDQDLKSQFLRYKNHILKREKYESTIYFIWILTITPAFFFEKDITVFTVIKGMVIMYIFTSLGNRLFKKVKAELKLLELQINKNHTTHNLEY